VGGEFEIHRGSNRVLPVGNWGMEKPKILLKVPRDPREPSECTACGHQSTEPDVLKKFRDKCNEDASQAADRIVREATGD